jgi:hypothetical protein
MYFNSESCMPTWSYIGHAKFLNLWEGDFLTFFPTCFASPNFTKMVVGPWHLPWGFFAQNPEDSRRENLVPHWGNLWSFAKLGQHKEAGGSGLFWMLLGLLKTNTVSSMVFRNSVSDDLLHACIITFFFFFIHALIIVDMGVSKLFKIWK